MNKLDQFQVAQPLSPSTEFPQAFLPLLLDPLSLALRPSMPSRGHTSAPSAARGLFFYVIFCIKGFGRYCVTDLIRKVPTRRFQVQDNHRPAEPRQLYPQQAIDARVRRLVPGYGIHEGTVIFPGGPNEPASASAVSQSVQEILARSAKEVCGFFSSFTCLSSHKYCMPRTVGTLKAMKLIRRQPEKQTVSTVQQCTRLASLSRVTLEGEEEGVEDTVEEGEMEEGRGIRVEECSRDHVSL